MKTLIFVLVLVSSGANPRVHCIKDTVTEDIELERQLKLIMKLKEPLAFITQELVRVKCHFLMCGFKMEVITKSVLDGR